MNSLFLFSILVFVLVISFVSSQNLITNNPTPPNQAPNVVNLQRIINSTVGSVTSGDGCIFVNPTTGNVIITFNTSCGAAGSPVTSVTGTLPYMIISPTTGAVVVNFNESQLNTTIDRRQNLTWAFNQSNIAFNYNQTTAVFLMSLLNNTIADFGVRVGFNSTFNQSDFNFIQNITGYTCGTGLVVQGVNTNGTVKCVIDANSGGVISNSSLNLVYLNLSGTNANQNINVGIYNITANWFKGLHDWIIGANPSARYLTFNGSTLDFSEANLNTTIDRRQNLTWAFNQSNIAFNYNQTNLSWYPFQQNNSAYDCSAGSLVIGIQNNGTVLCATDSNSGGTMSNSSLNNTYLNLSGTNANQNINVGIYNITANWFKGLHDWIIGVQPSQRYLNFNGSTLLFNETNLNSTIDNRASGITSATANSTYVRKAGDNMTGYLGFDQTGLGAWETFRFFGINLGTITSEVGVFEFHALSNFDFYFSNTARDTLIELLDAGYIKLLANNNVQIGSLSFTTIDTNATRTTIYNNVTVSGSFANFTNNVNIQGNLSVRNISVSLDVCNTSGRCLNKSLQITEPTTNNTIPYFNSNTRTWNVVASPTSSKYLVYCDSGGLQWLGFAGVCPL